MVTDAGTPGISDPGSPLVAAAREDGRRGRGAARAGGVRLRGGAVGLRPAAVRLRRLSAARRRGRGGPRSAPSSATTTVWYEAPHRIRESLADLAAVAPERRVFLVRELSKLHEQQVLGTRGRGRGGASRSRCAGEIAFVVEGGAAEAGSAAPASADELDAAIDALLGEGLTTSAIAKRLADAGHGERRHLYARVGERRTGRAEPE